MKIRRAAVNGRRKVVEVSVGRRRLVYPFARLRPKPSADDPIVGIRVDREIASEGFTCCQESDLRNATSTADGRIDLVLYRGRFRVIDVTVEGTDPATSKTPSGLWPSDHFGVLANVELVP